MADEANQTGLKPVERPLNLIPVGMKEAALDSPTFRATAFHFADQIELVERWLEGYARAAAKLASEVSSLESMVNSMLTHSAPPPQVSEAVLDHDYTMLALKRYGEGAREFWQYTLRGFKRYDTAVVDPIKHFLNNELRTFKEAKRTMDACQRTFDGVISRYASQSKTKEASSLREDAFQLYEARKAYLKAAMDFCTLAPQLRASLDKLIVKVFAEQWKEMRSAREANGTMFTKWNSEIERVRGWSKEMEDSERAFKRELLAARRQIEDNADELWRPSRELEDYSASTVPFTATGAASTTRTPGKSGRETSEKQGWLFLKTVSGKPARTSWSRRWFFVKNGIFGWLVQGSRSGGVEESEKIGVLLCSIKPAVQEERRFCFEVKTKDTSIVLQAEAQAELSEWITAFELAKRRALEDPTSTESQPGASGTDPAFAISPPIAPEFAARLEERHARDASDDASGLAAPERAEMAPGTQNRASFDVNAARRVTSPESNESGRDPASRLMQKLDLHKRGNQTTSGTSASTSAGGIASLISASHNVLPVGPGAPASSSAPGDGFRRNFTMPSSTLAPSTLANPPAPTNLSHTAVIVSGERDLGPSRADGSGMPSGLMANLWGSTNWGYVNWLGENSKPPPAPIESENGANTSPQPRQVSVSHDDSEIADRGREQTAQPGKDETLTPNKVVHRKTVSAAPNIAAGSTTPTKPTLDGPEQYPNYYPLPLKAQNAQFRMLFPSVPRNEKPVLVFRATWNPNELQEFPGRVYVTTREIYFYSHHLGLVLITGVDLTNVTDVTAAPGRDCDYIYLHLKDPGRTTAPKRITIKTFLEPMKLLQRRMNFLVHNANAESPVAIEEVLKTLIKMEVEEPKRSSSVESWEDVAYSPGGENPPGGARDSPERSRRDVKASIRIDGNLYGEPLAKTGKEIQKFKLPAQAVQYAPTGMQAVVSRDFTVSAKALFHVMFGDKSAVFQLLYCNRWGENIVQSVWAKSEFGHWVRKFESKGKATPGEDVQMIDVLNDHLCYVITNTKYPWYLPFSDRLKLTTKLVITHTAKSRCKLAIYQQINWIRTPPPSYLRGLVDKQALNSLEADALDLTNVAMDQVSRLGSHSKTNKAIEIFGNVGQQLAVPQIDTTAVPDIAPRAVRVKAKKVKMTLRGLLLNDAVSRLARGLEMLLDGVVALGNGVVSVCSAHSLLVCILLVSVLYNSWHGYREGLTWHHERSAGKFMARLGVTPDPIMGKAVYLQDIEELVAQPPSLFNDTVAGGLARETCQSTFGQQLTSVAPAAVSQRAGARLHRSREAIARYRHDLLVALRIVNKVERDVVEAEWEEWVRVEARRCAKVEAMLRRQSEPDKAKAKSEGKGVRELDMELGQDFERYCESCREAAAVFGDETATT